MDIIFEDSDIIEKNENILIHLFFNIVNYDFRNGFFSDESSIRDMESCGFSDEDYIALSKEYYETCPSNITYAEGQRHYQKLSHIRFDNMVIEKFEQIYGIVIDVKTHLLKDFILILKESFPNRDWDKENLFIIKTLDNRLDKEEQSILEEHKNQDKKVVKLPVRKKLSPEEIKNGLNEFLMVKELGMKWEEARELAKFNFDKKMEGKEFIPYIPEQKVKKPKF